MKENLGFWKNERNKFQIKELQQKLSSEIIKKTCGR